MTKNTKWEFIEKEIWIMTFGGAFQRANVYKEDASDRKRKNFRDEVKEYVCDLVEKYYSKVIDEEQHVRNIEELCDWASRKHGDILENGRLRIGVGQKIFNLYLKYLWCLNEIETPPHCPIDRTIVSIISKKSIKWTTLDDIDEYKNLIEKAKKKANSKSLAEWELETRMR